MMQRQNHAIKICAKNRCVFRKREMHRFLFLKKAIEELCSKNGEADWLCFLLSASSAQEYRGMQSLCAGYRGAAHCWGQGVRVAGGDLCGNTAKAPTDTKWRRAHWQVKGSQPHRVKGETPCPRRNVALRQFVLGSTCRKICRFGGFAAAPLRGNFAKIGGKRVETDTTQWQSRKKRNL